jgi:predicted Rossmann-fold nucleotide-binding protein
VKESRGRIIEVDSTEEFDRRLASGTRSLSGWHLRAIDLSARGTQLADLHVAGALFLGCGFAPGDEDLVRDRGGIVFPTVPDVPVDTYRTALYRPDELYDTAAYDASLDARVYAWSRQHDGPDRALARALHDHAIDEALADWIRGRRLVGVMGGHAIERDDPAYADAARLGHLLAQECVVATGGGPGAMEAANLGAWLSGRPEATIADAVGVLAAVPSFRPSVGAWAGTAFAVRDRWPDGAASLGIPTWHYGHEPPNAFATAVAKYFQNATREAILLQVCEAGIVFLPGAGGTVQEIFQDACENYYADESSVAPMVLVGRDHWTQVVPAWPLLETLSRGRPMEDAVHLVDTVEEAAALVSR